MANGYSTSVSGMGITQTSVIPQGNTSNSNVMTGGVMPRTGRRNRGRNLKIDLSIEDVTFIRKRYAPNNDTDDPTCAIMRAYFNDLNRNPNLDTPLYPCEGFEPGVTEQYVTVNYRISGQSNKTRIFRFFLDANGQCRCEIVNRIPEDFEDRGSGPTGPSGGMGITQTSVIPQGNMNVIQVNENTPNLQLIQSFPVVSRNGNVHIHRDPTNGQLYEMTDEFHSMIPQILARNSGVMTGGVMPTSGGKILVGGNISTSLLREDPPQPTVSINGLPYKQTPKNGSIYSIFPEYFGGKRTTYIDGVIYKQNNIPSSDTQTIMSRRQINSSIQRQPAARIQFSYPSVQKSESSTSNRIVSVVTPYRHAYPSIK